MQRLFPIAALLTSAACAQPGLTKYLEQHREALDLAKFEAKTLDVRDKQIILLGEVHRIAINEDLDLAMLQYLHREAGVRVYVMELGYSVGLALNAYLANGKEQTLDFLMREFQGSPSWTKERRAFYVRLRQWNQTLPASERVRFVGIDVEHQGTVAVAVLRDLMPAAAPRELRAGRTEKFAASLESHRAEYKSLLGDRFFDFELIVGNLAAAREFYAAGETPRAYAIRERTIYETFCKLYPRMGGGRWYGRWGAFHVLQHRSEDRDRFADMLNGPGSPVAGKVVSILPVYGGNSAPVAPHAMFDAAAAGPITLFDLAGEGSPFRQKIATFLKGEAPPAEFGRYVVLIRNVTPSRPLKSSEFEDLPPVVVRTVPESARTDVPADLTEVRITFSKDMTDGSWSWCTVPGFEMPLSGIHYEADHRTIVARVKLAPGKQYAVSVNGESSECKSFSDTKGTPAMPYVLSFQTAK